MCLHRGLWLANEPESGRWTAGCLAEGLPGQGKHGDSVWSLKHLEGFFGDSKTEFLK